MRGSPLSFSLSLLTLLSLPVMADIQANDDMRSVPANTPVIIDVLANDSGGDALLIVSFTQPANGRVEPSGIGLRYVPAAGFAGQDSFEYTITDDDGEPSTAMVTVNVGADGAEFTAAAALMASVPRVLDEAQRSHSSSIRRFTQMRLHNQRISDGMVVLGAGAGDNLLPRGGLFVSLDQRQGEHESVPQTQGFDNDVTSATVGADFYVGAQTSVGVALGLSDASVALVQDGGELESQAWSAIAFGSWQAEQWFAEAQLGYTDARYDFRVPETSDADVDGEADGQFFLARGQWSYNRGAWQVSPGLGLSWQRNKNAPDASVLMNSTLAFDPQTTEHWQWLASLDTSYAFPMSWGVLVPQLSVIAENCFDSSSSGGVANADTVSASLGQALFLDKQQFVIDAGLSAIWPRGWTGFVNLQALAGNSYYQSSAVSAGFRWEF